MKKKLAIGSVLTLALIIIVTQQTLLMGQEEKTSAPGQPTPEEMAAMQAEWMRVASPGKHHKHLDYFVGNWKTKTSIWMAGPGSQPMVSEGSSEVKWVLGGRYTMDTHKGTMMGQPYEGIGFTGYDNYRNLYVGSWYSNMGTNVLTMAGSRHPETGIFTLYGEMDEPSLKVVGRTVKYVTRIVDKNHYVFSIIDLHASDDYKVIEIEYTRRP